VIKNVGELYVTQVEFQKALMDQYKLYLELADRLSARRMLANTFFLSVNSALAGGVFLSLEKIKQIDLIFVVGFFTICICFCFIWWLVIHSYRQLNSGKFKVIHDMEKMLPYSCFDYEWELLGKGKELNKYFPLTHVEKWVPLIFCFLYLIILCSL